MTDNLTWLAEMLGKMTPGPIRFRNGYCYQANTEVDGEFDDALWHAKPLHADARGIALLVNVVKELVEVVRAAHDIRGWPEGDFDRFQACNEALAALNAALEKERGKP